MLTGNPDTKELAASFDVTTSQLVELASSFEPDELNIVPFTGSWTAGQLIEHIIKSLISVENAMLSGTGTCEREPDERVLRFADYKVNFDLGDCDNILRVKSFTEPIQSSLLIHLLNDLGFTAEVLPDEVP